jgi:hypothetical protein
MSLLAVARAYYRKQARISRIAQESARQVWSGVQFGDLDASWARLAAQMVVAVSSAQMLAARGAEPYLDEMLEEQGAENDRMADLDPKKLAGVASDGRSLDALLYASIIAVKLALTAPAAPKDRAMASGEATLLQIVGTQVADAGRVATGMAITATPSVTRWVRMTSSGACGRCAILAGKVYAVNRGFDRHPGCLCQHIPLSENVSNDVTTNPRKYFDSLSREKQDQLFGKERTERILAGEDMSRVVNSGRTSTSTAGGVRPAKARAMPERVMAKAGSRDEAVSALRRAGFLT